MPTAKAKASNRVRRIKLVQVVKAKKKTQGPASKPIPVPATNYAARLTRLRGFVTQAGLDHLLVTNPLDVAYLTGFLGGDSYLLVGPESATIISDFRYEEELRSVKKLASIFIRKGAMTQAVAEVFGGTKIDRCGLQAEVVTMAEREALMAAIGDPVSGRLVSTTGILAKMRVIKDASEVAMIRRAIQIQEQALLATLPTIKIGKGGGGAGQTEQEIAARLEAEMKMRGSREPGFQTIVAARANGSLPHYRPAAVKTAAKQPLLIDWGATYLGYHGDMTRTFSLGAWPKKVKEVFEIVLDAQLMAAEALGPGKSTREIDGVARNYITARGYGDQFGHGLGHGLGLNGHEDPRLTHMLKETTLQVGQVVTVEPGIYLPGVGGVRIEDDYLITETGAENLCTLPKDLEWSTL